MNASVVDNPSVVELEAEVTKSRERLRASLESLRSPERVAGFKAELRSEKDDLVHMASDAAREAAGHMIEDVKARAMANPAAALSIGAGVAVHAHVLASSALALENPLKQGWVYYFSAITMTQIPLNQTPILAPFWSLSYEACFYAIVLAGLAIASRVRRLDLIALLHGVVVRLLVLHFLEGDADIAAEQLVFEPLRPWVGPDHRGGWPDRRNGFQCAAGQVAVPGRRGG